MIINKTIKTLLLLILPVLLFSGCRNNSTANMLDGSFLPPPGADSNPPAIISPAHNEKVTDCSALLEWRSVYDAASYTVTVSTDSDYNNQIPGSPFFLPAPARGSQYLSHSLDNLSEGQTYYWNVRADVTKTGLFSESAFLVLNDSIYVYFPHTENCPNNIDMTGTKEKPYQSIEKGIEEAKRLEITTVRVASRGKKSNDEFAAYNEIVSLTEGISLMGGYSRGFSNTDRNIDPHNDINKTIIEGRSGLAVLAIGITNTEPLLEGFTILSSDAAGNTKAVSIENCKAIVRIKNCVIASGKSHMYYSGLSCGVFIQKSSPIIENNIISAGDSNYRSYGMYNISSSPALKDNIITSGLAIYRSCGMQNFNSDPELENNSISDCK
ncbi:MAG: hypothetical protein GY754_15425 [bacterium]|nr:hypothetical protein [bacterium]